MERSAGQPIRISPKVIQQRGGVVVLSIKEYQKLLASAVPTYYLQGKAAIQLDRLVANGLVEAILEDYEMVRSAAYRESIAVARKQIKQGQSCKLDLKTGQFVKAPKR